MFELLDVSSQKNVRSSSEPLPPTLRGQSRARCLSALDVLTFSLGEPFAPCLASASLRPDAPAPLPSHEVPSTAPKTCPGRNLANDLGSQESRPAPADPSVVDPSITSDARISQPPIATPEVTEGSSRHALHDDQGPKHAENAPASPHSTGNVADTQLESTQKRVVKRRPITRSNESSPIPADEDKTPPETNPVCIFLRTTYARDFCSLSLNTLIG